MANILQDEHEGLLAIVGRPNVGKSTLFNKMVGRRRAIVGDEPGITRDRLYGKVRWNGRQFRVVDTGGIVPEDKELIPSEIFRQARVALDEASAVVMVTDVRTALTGPDMELARLLQKLGKPLYLAVNKVDDPKLEAEAENFRHAGDQEPVGDLGRALDRGGGADRRADDGDSDDCRGGRREAAEQLCAPHRARRRRVRERRSTS